MQLRDCLFVPLVLMISCATRQPSPDCLTEADAAPALARLMASLQHLSAELRPQLTGEHCAKRIYQAGPYRIVIHRRTADGMIAASASTAQPTSLPEECLTRALADLKELDGIETLFGNDQKGMGPLWLDADIGPVKWIACGGKGSVYRLSLATLVHEMIHDLYRPDCLYDLKDGQYHCLALDRDLPSRSVAEIREFPTAQTQIKKLLTQVQDVYLKGGDQPPLAIFDELNAYTATAKVLIATLEKQGREGVYEQQKRPVLLLPLFLVYTLRYLEHVRSGDISAYQRNFGRGGSNWKVLESLLHNGEKTYQEWQFELSRHQLKELEIEQNLWADYLKLRTRLYLLN